jgi:hypothetical protein
MKVMKRFCNFALKSREKWRGKGVRRNKRESSLMQCLPRPRVPALASHLVHLDQASRQVRSFCCCFSYHVITKTADPSSRSRKRVMFSCQNIQEWHATSFLVLLNRQCFDRETRHGFGNRTTCICSYLCMPGDLCACLSVSLIRKFVQLLMIVGQAQGQIE